MAKTKKNIFFILSFSLLMVSLLLKQLAFFYPYSVEYAYSRNVYKYISEFLSITFNNMPFSTGELALIILIILLIVKTVNILYSVFKKTIKIKEAVLGICINSISFFSIVYSIFIFFWGLNYYRLPFGEIFGLNTRPSQLNELIVLCENLISQSNQLSILAKNHKNYLFDSKIDYINYIIKSAHLGYENASENYPVLKGKTVKAKKIVFSNFLSYTGISGIYFPFTGEANINTYIPKPMLPSTVMHELAHQKGFAREDEANYIAYITCMAHSDPEFNYSGSILALIYSMNALYNNDINMYKTLQLKYNDYLRQDLNSINSFWQSYEGPVERFSNKVNNAYLKSNMQKDGVKSYGRMVDLLLAEYRNKYSNH